MSRWGERASPAIIMSRKNGQGKWYWLSARIILHCFPHQFSNSLKVEGQTVVRAIHTIFVSVASSCHTSVVSQVTGKNDPSNIRCTERNKNNQLDHFEFYRVGSRIRSQLHQGIVKACWWAWFWRNLLFDAFLMSRSGIKSPWWCMIRFWNHQDTKFLCVIKKLVFFVFL